MSASIILSDSTGTPAYRGGGTWKLRSYQGAARIWKSKAEKRESPMIINDHLNFG